MSGVPGMDSQSSGNFVLPAALLAQYPALQTLQWDQIPAADDPSDIGGRSSFDASSGGEFGFDDDEPGMSGGYGNSSAMYGVNNSGQILGVNPGEPGYDQKWT